MNVDLIIPILVLGYFAIGLIITSEFIIDDEGGNYLSLGDFLFGAIFLPFVVPVIIAMVITIYLYDIISEFFAKKRIYIPSYNEH
jgi:hypothetical protein